MKKTLAALMLVPVLTGCWTFDETPYPKVAPTPAAEKAKALTLAVTGFSAVLTEYEAVHGYQSVYVPGFCTRHYCDPGHFETMPTVTYVPQLRATDMFLRRAVDAFEGAGYTISTLKSDRNVEVHFEGPFVTAGEELKKSAWQLFTLFLCDYGKVRWTAKLRIRDSATGKLLYHQDYDQVFETHEFGLIPLFGVAAMRETSPVHMQSWCLAALTDRAVADATAYLSR